MTETRFGPVEKAVPTVRGLASGSVHDPKARVLGCHAEVLDFFQLLLI